MVLSIAIISRCVRGSITSRDLSKKAVGTREPAHANRSALSEAIVSPEAAFDCTAAHARSFDGGGGGVGGNGSDR